MAFRGNAGRANYTPHAIAQYPASNWYHPPFFGGQAIKAVPVGGGGGGAPAVPTTGQIWPRGNY